MSSRCRNSAIALCILCCVVYLCACDREKREYRAAPLPENGPAAESLSTLQPAGASPPASDPRGKEYEENAYHVSQGERLYRWFNCNGCHAAGGGDIGPPLMDDQWRYGGKIDQIYATIMDGRPFGMPSFRGKIPDQQAWEIAAYVRAMSGNVPKDAAPSRPEGMTATPPLSRTSAQPPKNSEQEPQH
jgi:cytochrome c oxidase cbb3-type subunit III